MRVLVAVLVLGLILAGVVGVARRSGWADGVGLAGVTSRTVAEAFLVVAAAVVVIVIVVAVAD